MRTSSNSLALKSLFQVLSNTALRTSRVLTPGDRDHRLSLYALELALFGRLLTLEL